MRDGGAPGEPLGAPGRRAALIAGVYALAAVLWIAASDRLLDFLPLDVPTLTRLQTLKGWFFVAITAALLYAAIRRELDQRRAIAERLGVSEEKFRLLIERALAGIYIIRDGRFAYVNPRFAEIFGRPAESIVSALSVAELIAPEDREKVLENLRRRLSGEVSYLSYTFRGLRADGAVLELEVAGVTTEFDGRPAIIGTLLDQTERSALQRKALQAQKLEILGLLAGGIVHDVNNVVSTIAGHAQILVLDLPGGSPLRRDAQEILACAEHASSLTRQLLTFSRGQKPDRAAVDVAAAVRGCAAMLRGAAGEGVRLDVEIEDGLGAVLVVPGQVEQVLMNLVLNARDATPRGGVVFVSARRGVLSAAGTAARPCAVLSVRDTGAGMDRATRGRVFEVFFTTKPAGKGTGLGLPTVQRIAEDAGGRVDIESEPGVGTTVRVLLPLAETAS
ncbi:MAG: PAS domain S-box protein [Elusimicrobia bacterium]|nr:PAS domain S-box protein [Elusimicrobiota bacterium]